MRPNTTRCSFTTMHVSQSAAVRRATLTVSSMPQVGTSARAMSLRRIELAAVPSSGSPYAPQSAFPAEYS